LVNSRRKGQTGFGGFDQAIAGAIYFTFHDRKNNLVSIVQITHQFKFFTLRFLPRQNIENKFVLTNKSFCNFHPVRCLRVARKPLQPVQEYK